MPQISGGAPRAEVAAADIDYYNVRENRVKVYERDGYKSAVIVRSN